MSRCLHSIIAFEYFAKKIQVEVGSGKILGVATLEEEKVLVSCEERQLVLLGRDGKVEGESLLPPSNNCWMTAATSWGNDLVVVGGRSGGLHCFSSGLDNLVASWPGLHGKQGVSALVAEDRSSLWSAGRDGKIRRLGRRDGGVQVSKVLIQDEYSASFLDGLQVWQ